MNRIFVSLTVVANIALGVAVWYGLSIGGTITDLDRARHSMSMHLLVALAASLFVLLMHSAALTYFMATGRWIEEASTAYRLDARFRTENIRLKYRVIPWMVACVVLVIVTGAVGAMADPLSKATASIASTAHFTLAMLTLLMNLLVSWAEFQAIRRNGTLVAGAWNAVKEIRKARGLS